MPAAVAKIAVSAATFWLDKPYDYLIPSELTGKILPGMRVFVPFSKGNRKCEGIVLAVTDNSSFSKLKPILSVLDEEPILTDHQIKLALFMRERFFCTVYDAVRAILPTGLWFDEDGKRKVKDKTIEMARLAVSTEEAAAISAAKKLRAPLQSAILEELCTFDCLASHELLLHCSAGKSSLKALVKEGLVELYKKEAFRRPEIFVGETEALPILNSEQNEVFEGINKLAMSGESGAALLFGVTGSGKTSVYVHLIEQQLERNRSVILLVPEIALTPQMIRSFSTYFGEEVAVLHSSLGVAERYDEWKRVKTGKARVVIGTRSAVFAPCENLGLVIIDEEQEESYKSENTPRYNAIDVAKFRCIKSGCYLLLASATPDVVSMHNAKIGRYQLFRLDKRYNEMDLPNVKIVDMKRELRRGNGGSISSFLRQELEENVSRGEQSILFINRRGANRLISCVDCGYTYSCPKCSVSYTYHSAKNRLICHYCGSSRWVDDNCPECGGQLRGIGIGTQMVEAELKELFPDKEILRMDTDTVTAAGSHQKLLDKFRDENIPFMVGTQMVTKGLNFENLTLVGVLSADQSLYSGDFRAGERTFALITQVVGRSGRGLKPGRAVIQTYTPDNETILQAAAQDYEAFYDSEIELRKLQNTPPFSQMLSVTASGLVEEQVYEACKHIKKRLEAIFAGGNLAVVTGPAPLFVVKINNRYRYRVMIYGNIDARIRSTVAGIVIETSTDKRFSKVSVFADNDPRD